MVHAWVGQILLNCDVFKRFFVRPTSGLGYQAAKPHAPLGFRSNFRRFHDYLSQRSLIAHAPPISDTPTRCAMGVRSSLSSLRSSSTECSSSSVS